MAALRLPTVARPPPPTSGVGDAEAPPGEHGAEADEREQPGDPERQRHAPVIGDAAHAEGAERKDASVEEGVEAHDADAELVGRGELELHGDAVSYYHTDTVQ